jgi:CRISPR-associated endonuclease/helicase Cas3
LRSSTPAALFARSHTLKQDEDVIYGAAYSAAWEWLLSIADAGRRVDFGIAAMGRQLPSEPDRLTTLCAPVLHAPILLPAHLDHLVQTSPRPAPEPAIAVFLHGADTAPGDVQIVWRADLDEENEHRWEELAAIIPPTSAEAMPVPFAAARRWLLGGEPEIFGDVEGAPETEPDEKESERPRQIVRWLGTDEIRSVSARDIQPGDTIMVPASYGGADEFGWNPESTEPVRDLADLVSWEARGRATLRFHPALIRGWLTAEASLERIRALLHELERAFDREEPDAERAREILETLAATEPLALHVRDICGALADDLRAKRKPQQIGERLAALIASRRYPPRSQWAAESDFFGDSDQSSLTGPVKSIPLAGHLAAVAEKAASYARLCGLDQNLQRVLRLAAELHDTGKADERFQAWLSGGNRLAAKKAGLLAKSGVNRDRRASDLARTLGGYPRGARHELQSVALVAGASFPGLDAIERDLLLHLIASHHGRCRPFAPVVADERPVEVAFTAPCGPLSAASAHHLERLDSGVAERFWQLTRHFGWFGLAILETILRLADHRQSEDEQSGDDAR